jgi:hypothetical protein
MKNLIKELKMVIINAAFRLRATSDVAVKTPEIIELLKRYAKVYRAIRELRYDDYNLDVTVQYGVDDLWNSAKRNNDPVWLLKDEIDYMEETLKKYIKEDLHKTLK